MGQKLITKKVTKPVMVDLLPKSALGKRVKGQPPQTARNAKDSAVDPKRRVRIFVSHKSNDANFAKDIKESLIALGNNRLDVFVSSTIPWASDWKPEVYQALQQADWLLLLYTDPDERWDWCVYEGGYFVGRNSLGDGANDAAVFGKKVFVLHADKVSAPDPFKCFQAYGATRARIEDLLKQIFTQPIAPGIEPINSALSVTSLLFTTVRELLFRGLGIEPQVVPLLPTLEIDVPQTGADAFRKGRPVPPETAINGEQALSLLGPQFKSTITWSDLEKFYEIEPGTLELPPVGPHTGNAKATSADRMSEWWGQLVSTIRAISNYKPAGLPMLRPFNGDATVYRPAVEQFIVRANGSLRFQIVFVQVPAEYRAWPSGSMGAAVHLLMLARMFRYGVIKPLADAVANAAVKSDTAALSTALQNAVESTRNVEVESASRGIPDFATAKLAFSSDQDLKRANARVAEFTKIVQDWVGVRKTLVAEAAKREPNFPAVDGIVVEMASVNTRFFQLIAARFHELVDQLKDGPL